MRQSTFGIDGSGITSLSNAWLVLSYLWLPYVILPIPIWIFTNIQRPAELPVVNVVAFALLLVSVIPVYLAQRIAGDATAVR